MFFRRSLTLIGSRALSDVLQLLLYVAIVRRFSEQDVGDYSFAFAIAMVLGMLVGLGARVLVTREVSNDPELGAAYPANLLVLHGSLSLFVGAGLVIWAHFAGISGSLTVLCALAFVSAGLSNAGYSAVGVIDASGQVKRGAQAEVLGKTCTVLLGFAALLAGLEIVFVMVAQVVGALCYLTLAMQRAAKVYGPLAWKIDWALILRTARSAMPFALAAILYALYSRVDIIMLHRIVGAEQTAYYAVAFRVIETTFVIATMSGIAMFPELAAGGREGSSVRRSIFIDALRWLSILGAFVAVLLFVSGDRLMTLVFGADLAPAGDLVQVMALLVVIGYVKEPLWRLLISQRREMLRLYIQAPAVALNVVLNFLLIPRYGAMGAVVASVVSELLMLFGFAVAALRAEWLSYARTGGWSAAVIAGCLLGSELKSIMEPLVAGIVSVTVLAILLVVFRVVSIDEVSELVRKAGRRGQSVNIDRK